MNVKSKCEDSTSDRWYEIQLQLDNGKLEMKIPKSKAMNPWVKENNEYLIEHNHFYSN